MPKYMVAIREVVLHEIEVEASSEGDAQAIAYEQYCNYPEYRIELERVIAHNVESEGTEYFRNDIEVSEIVKTS